ncbi:hypothetical protein DFH09DRAFT_1368949 [Mycena vulgaris]|nr:hypothetical protein DFH09DRAFT_1368949 [Mycena vulgaris]
MILRARSELGLKGLADVKITRASPVLGYQPPRVRTPLPAGYAWTRATGEEESSFEFDADAVHSSSPVYARPRRHPHSHSHTLPEAPTPDSSFDLSFISDTSSSTSSSDNPTSTWPSSPSDTSFTLPPPPTRGLGLGLLGLFNADGAPFDGMGVLSFGCDSGEREREREREESEREMERGLSRAFLEEAARTWAADPHHRILSVIEEQGDECEEETQERECEDEVQEQEEQERKPRPHAVRRPRKEDHLALEVEAAGAGSALEDVRSRPALEDTRPGSALEDTGARPALALGGPCESRDPLLARLMLLVLPGVHA